MEQEVSSALSSLPGQLSFAALVGLFVLAVWRGWLVPRKTVDDIRADRDARLAEVKEQFAARLAEANGRAAEWREAYFLSQEALAAVRAQNNDLLELARTSSHVLQSLPLPPDTGEVQHG